MAASQHWPGSPDVRGQVLSLKSSMLRMSSVIIMTVIISCHLQSRLLENTATVEREEREVTRAGSQATLLAVYTICEV